MAINKNAMIRYKVLDNCFRNTGKKYLVKDLLNECNKVLVDIDPESSGIERRQLYIDIAFMESNEGWSIELLRERDGRYVYYSYADPSFSINNMPLNEMEIDQIRSAMEILAQFEGMPQFEWVHEIMPKLKLGINKEVEQTGIISFDNNQYLKGIEYLGRLYNAIHYKKILLITYQPFNASAPTDITIHPYYLKQYNNRWFLFGYNPENGKHDWNMALDRIVSVKEIEGVFHQNKEIDWAEYFEDIIGVTKPEEANVENVVLQFYGKTGKYIATKPLHGSQKPKWLDENTFEVRLQIIINNELERLILSYAESAAVIQPKSLTDTLKKRLQEALKYY